MRLLGAATGSALGAAALVLLVFAARERETARAGVLSAVGAAALTLSGQSLGSALVARLEALAPPRVPPGSAGTGAAPAGGPMILDTNILIDGRIADVCETGFLQGDLVVPGFVLRELQHVADSSDPLRRSRGRRGLEALARMRKAGTPAVAISERDFPQVREVDGKLVALARETGGRIVSNDYNLNKVAEVSGVTVLSLNQLARALKPPAIPGDQLHVAVLKEGKEANQGVGYLDDGTMVVVDNARRLIGRTLEVTVTSTIQTSAGRMVFAAPRDGAAGAAEPPA